MHNDPNSPINFQSDGDDDQSNWLLSYADMMTLIAIFFILLMIFANYTPPIKSKIDQEASKLSGEKDQVESIEDLKEIVNDIKKNQKLEEQVKVQMDGRQLILTFSSSALFDTAQDSLREDVELSLDTLIDLIQKKDAKFRIIVEGHTDDRPLKPGASFRSNWQLSASRASRILEKFESSGFQKNQLLGIGYADTKPIVPNRDKEGNTLEENMQLNRRVVIKVLALPKGVQEASFEAIDGHLMPTTDPSKTVSPQQIEKPRL